jgi:hypothetical protein
MYTLSIFIEGNLMDADECFCLHFVCARLVQYADKLAGTEIVAGDVTDIDSLKAALAGCEVRSLIPQPQHEATLTTRRNEYYKIESNSACWFGVTWSASSIRTVPPHTQRRVPLSTFVLSPSFCLAMHSCGLQAVVYAASTSRYFGAKEVDCDGVKVTAEVAAAVGLKRMVLVSSAGGTLVSDFSPARHPASMI